MKKIETGLISLVLSMNVMAQCTAEINKEFLSIQKHSTYDINRLETIYSFCPKAPVKMFLYIAKGDVFESNGEVESAYYQYIRARAKYGDINGNYIRTHKQIYKVVLKNLEKKIEQYMPKTANEITRSMTEKVINRGAGLTIEYKIEDLPLNFQSDSSEIKQGVNKEQASEIYKVLSSKKYQGKVIRIVGYTDTSGKPFYNEKLSIRRANSLAKYLKKKGLTNKIKHDGKGESRPVCTQGEIVSQKNYNFKCSIKEDKYRSRRVNITIEDK